MYMAQCHIPPLVWSPCCGELRLLWTRNAKRGSLIPLSLALVYFRPTPSNHTIADNRKDRA
jgi:hypothetical protein